MKREKLVPKAKRKPVSPVTVSFGAWNDKPRSKCNVVAGCGKKDEFLIFGGDGKTMLSRLSYRSCEKHVGLAVRRVLDGSRT